MVARSSKTISKENVLFWDELCGSNLARELGIVDSSLESLKKYDEWYFDFYPYLSTHIDFDDLRGKEILEIGLGYGTVSQKLAETGAVYSGMDIAAGPVSMVSHRLKQNGLKGVAIQNSILEPCFTNESFDAIIAIGCLQHTGNLLQAIDNCYNLLRPGGRMTFMVYYAYSFRRWIRAPKDTLAYLIKETKGFRGVVESSNSRQRATYDSNLSGEGAPHTDWISKKSLADLCGKYSDVKMHIENIDGISRFKYLSRKRLLRTKIPRLMGLDLYLTAIK